MLLEAFLTTSLSDIYSWIRCSGASWPFELYVPLVLRYILYPTLGWLYTVPRPQFLFLTFSWACPSPQCPSSSLNLSDSPGPTKPSISVSSKSPLRPVYPSVTIYTNSPVQKVTVLSCIAQELLILVKLRNKGLDHS